MSNVFQSAEEVLEIVFAVDELAAQQHRAELQSMVSEIENSCHDSARGVRKFLDDVLAMSEEVKAGRTRQIEATKARESQDALARQQARAERTALLKAGKIPVGSIADAALVKDATEGGTLVMSPSMHADRQFYRVNGQLTSWNGNTITATYADRMFAVLLTSNTKYLGNAQEQMRFNYPFSLVGRFVTTASAGSRMTAVFEAEYISVP
jgi:hypothetical protein